MKQIQVNPATFDGGQFATLYGLSPSFPTPFHVVNNADGTSTLHYPDSLPDNPTVAFTLQPTEDTKMANAVDTSALFNDASWAALSTAQKAEFIRTVLQKVVRFILRRAL